MRGPGPARWEKAQLEHHRLGVSMPSRRMPSSRPPLPPSTAPASSPAARCDARGASGRTARPRASRSSVDLWTARGDDGDDGIAATTTTTKRTRRRPRPVVVASPPPPSPQPQSPPPSPQPRSPPPSPPRPRGAAPPLFSRRGTTSSSNPSSTPSDEPPRDPSEVLGWKVVHARTGKQIGFVREVTAGSSSEEEDDSDGEDGDGGRRRLSRRRTSSNTLPDGERSADSSQTPSILRVVNDDVPLRFGPGAAEHHLLPYVRDVVPSARPAARTLLANPPKGLLRLGRQRLLIEYLRPRLHAIARELAGVESGGDGSWSRRRSEDDEVDEATGSGGGDEVEGATGSGGGDEVEGATGSGPEPSDGDPAPDSDEDDFDLDLDLEFDDQGLEVDRESPPASTRRSAIMMPTMAQLAAWRGGEGDGDEGGTTTTSAGQQLVRDVRDAGGAAVVAAAVGLRAKRRPVGYWDNLDTLDEELALFVAAHWVELSADDVALGGGRGKKSSYYFNVATRRVRWDAPVEPVSFDVDDCGTRVLVEGDGGGKRSSSERLMPGRAAVLAAGRYDLHHAIVYHGGYLAVQEALGRSPAWPPSAAHDDPEDLAAELRSFARAKRRRRRGVSSGDDALPMPTLDELADAGRSDLVQAVVRAGGVRAAAAVAGLVPRRPRATGDAGAPAASVERAAEEIRKFVLGREGGGSSSPDTLPTHAELLRAGRGDLRYALQTHGSAAVAAAAGLAVPRRGRRSGGGKRKEGGGGKRKEGGGGKRKEGGGGKRKEGVL